MQKPLLKLFIFMYINDINGERIEVTDLEKAISQASMFSSMKHEDAKFNKRDNELRIYWEDILVKLNELKN